MILRICYENNFWMKHMIIKFDIAKIMHRIMQNFLHQWILKKINWLNDHDYSFFFDFMIRKINLFIAKILNEFYANLFVFAQFEIWSSIENSSFASKFDQYQSFAIKFVFIRLFEIEKQFRFFKRNSIKNFRNFFNIQNIERSISIFFDDKFFL